MMAAKTEKPSQAEIDGMLQFAGNTGVRLLAYVADLEAESKRLRNDVEFCRDLFRSYSPESEIARWWPALWSSFQFWAARFDAHLKGEPDEDISFNNFLLPLQEKRDEHDKPATSG